MKRSLDQLSRNLAAGMSRRKAFWGFLSSLGAFSVLGGRTAKADAPECLEFCGAQAAAVLEMCLGASRTCPAGECAELTVLHFNGGPGINFNGGPHICVPV